MSSPRRTSPLVLATLLTASSLIPATGLLAQNTPVPVEQLRLDPAAHADEIRTVEGVVDRLVDRGASSTSAFYLEDDYGHQILVVTAGEPPARGARLTVTGVVTIDPSGDPVLASAEPIDGGEGEPPSWQGVGAPDPASQDADGDGVIDSEDACPASFAGEVVDASGCGESAGLRLGWIVGGLLGGALLIALLAALVWSSGTPFGDRDVELTTLSLWPPPSSDREFVGRTLRFERPDIGTLQLVPGRLEVTGGEDAGQVIRFVRVPGQNVEMTFGRASGGGPSHVQFKEQTVSRRHAVIRHRNNAWWLRNLSETNPTLLNGEALGGDEVPLSDEDRIEMGEVTFRFRAS